jgi:hypothetical protein
MNRSIRIGLIAEGEAELGASIPYIPNLPWHKELCVNLVLQKYSRTGIELFLSSALLPFLPNHGVIPLVENLVKSSPLVLDSLSLKKPNLDILLLLLLPDFYNLYQLFLSKVS